MHTYFNVFFEILIPSRLRLYKIQNILRTFDKNVAQNSLNRVFEVLEVRQ